jgi:hypothetical protein
MLLEDVIQQGPAGPVYHLVHILESIGAPIVGIGHLGTGPPLRVELPQEVEGGFSPYTRSIVLEIRKIGSVHGHHVIEAPKILRLDLS